MIDTSGIAFSVFGYIPFMLSVALAIVGLILTVRDLPSELSDSRIASRAGDIFHQLNCQN